MSKNIYLQAKKSLRKAVRHGLDGLRRLLMGCHYRLLAGLGVAAHELIYAAGGIDELALTGVEGV